MAKAGVVVAVETGHVSHGKQGDMTNPAGSLATTVVGLNGTNLAGLATGILKNTTGTGVQSIAAASDFPTLNQNTTGTAANVTGVVAAQMAARALITQPL
jgi:hypothetical protein